MLVFTFLAPLTSTHAYIIIAPSTPIPSPSWSHCRHPHTHSCSKTARFSAPTPLRDGGSVDGGPYDNRFMPYPWNPPHAYLSVNEYIDYYRGIFLDFCEQEYAEFAASRRRQRSTSHTVTFSLVAFSSKASKLLGDCQILSRVLGILPDAWSGIDDACMDLRSRPHISTSALGEENQSRIKSSVISVATIRT